MHWAGIGEAGLSIGIWFLYTVNRVFGRSVFRVLLAPALLYFALVRPSARRGSAEYLRRVGVIAPDAGAITRLTWVLRHFMRFGDALLDKALVWAGGIDVSEAPIEVAPSFEADVAGGRGGILVVAHFGNLEVLRAFARRLPVLKLNVLVHSTNSVRFMAMLRRLNPESTVDLLQVGDMDVTMATRLADRVETGEWIVIAADRVPLSGVANTVRVPFLGAGADFPTGPWILASALGCPVYWLHCVEHDGRYELHCQDFAPRVRLPRGQRTAALQAYAAEFAARLETCCRSEPLQWFNFYPFWPGSGDDAHHAG
ncbi:MAG: hypothetical protein H6934_07845 [Burkholderiaceae bacterium]|nr:hypothetical protein [Burkholderiaceae bacterium]